MELGRLAVDLTRAARAVARSGLLRPPPPRPGLLRVGLSLPLGPLSAGTAVAYQAAAQPERAAVVDDRGTVTWRELDRRANRLANALGERAPRGARVAFLLRNGREAVEGFAGAGRAGLAAVPLNVAAAPADLAHVAAAQQPAVVVVEPDLADAAAAAFGQGRLLVTGGSYESALAAASARPPLRRSSATIVTHTSGTTGRPKGAERDLRPQAAGAFVGFLERVPLHRDDELCIAAPLFHAFGQGMMGVALVLGTTMVLPARFDAERLLVRLAERDVTAAALVPVMLRRLLTLPDLSPLPSWRIGVLSGSALPRALRDAAEERFGRIFYDLYGSTEVGWATIATPEEHAQRPGTVGRPGPGVEVEVVDEDGRPVRPGTVGRVLVRSGLAFRGYTGSGQREAGPGVDTGDLGHLDEDGYLFVTGRADDLVVSGGENVHPGEVEAVLDAHPDVLEVAVLGAEDVEFGQVLHAHVVPRSGADLEVDDVLAHARAHLARYKVPKRVVLRSGLPRNAAGKVVKTEL